MKWWHRESVERERLAALVKATPAVGPTADEAGVYEFGATDRTDERIRREADARPEVKGYEFRTEPWVLQVLEHTARLQADAGVAAIDVALVADEPEEEKPKRKDPRWVHRVGVKSNAAVMGIPVPVVRTAKKEEN